MQDKISTLFTALKSEDIKFADVITFIEDHYTHTPTAFKNGEAYNESGQNQGSAKVFSFAQLNGLSETDTLLLFAEHYQSVLDTPSALDHQNIRQFIAQGWSGIVFEGSALQPK